jgi:DNA topoisomerase-3
MVVERDREIDAFKSQLFYEILVTFTQGFTGKYTYLDDNEQTTRLSDPSLAAQIAGEIRAASSGRISSVNIQRKTFSSPQLYSLLTLQKDANTKQSFTAAQTLDIAQSLYETHHLITYPRTESNYLPTDMIPQLGPTLRSLPARFRKQADTALACVEGNPPTKQHVDDSKLTDHHAIIPALNNKADAAQLSDAEAKIYELIVTRFLAMFYPDHVFNAITVETLFAQHMVVSRGKRTLQTGWRELYAGANQDDDDDKTEAADDNQLLPSLAQGQSLAASNVERKDGKTSPPNHHTDATLLTAMKRAGSRVRDETLAAFIKHAGIGTPATRAQIIEDLIGNRLIERKRKQLIATDPARALYDQLVPSLRDPATTAEWEQQLSDIEAGTKSSAEFISRLRAFLTQTVSQVKNTKPIPDEGAGACPACKTGRIRAIKGFYGCSRYREGCTFTLPGVWCKKKLTQKIIQELLGKRKTSLIKGFTSTKHQDYKYDAYLELDDQNKIKMSFPPR